MNQEEARIAELVNSPKGDTSPVRDTNRTTCRDTPADLSKRGSWFGNQDITQFPTTSNGGCAMGNQIAAVRPAVTDEVV
jgi:hypothetical protein